MGETGETAPPPSEPLREELEPEDDRDEEPELDEPEDEPDEPDEDPERREEDGMDVVDGVGSRGTVVAPAVGWLTGSAAVVTAWNVRLATMPAEAATARPAAAIRDRWAACLRRAGRLWG